MTSDDVPGLRVFEGLSEADHERVLELLGRRRFGPGEIVLAEGDNPQEMYVVRSGTADVFVTDRDGTEHLVGRVHAGTTLGEMSLFTGHAAAATVRASSDLDVLVMTDDDLERIGATFPKIYRNLGAMLSERLARTNRRTLRKAAGRLTFLHDRGAPPLLGYALACSVAWHTRSSPLLVVVDDHPPEVLATLATAGLGADPGLRTEVMVVPASGAFAPDALAATVDDLCAGHEHVFLQARDALQHGLADARRLDLVGADGRPGAESIAASRVRALCGWRSAAARSSRSGIVDVPELTAADEDALRDRRLPLSTAAGQALGCVARDVAALRVGLALGVGSSRGYAHVGVLQAFERAGVAFDCVAGTSIGAAVAVGHAIGNKPEQVADLLDRFAVRAFRPKLPTRSLLSARGLRDELRTVLGDTTFEDTVIPLAVTAADIAARRQVVFNRGLIRPALLASMAIPGIYPPQVVAGRTLVDGGILNPVPSNVAADLGSDTVVAVKLSGGAAQEPLQVEAAESSGRTPSILAVLMRSIEIMQSKIAADTAAAATILIAPTFGEDDAVPLRRFTEGRRYIELGEAAAEATLPRLKAALPWLRD